MRRALWILALPSLGLLLWALWPVDEREQARSLPERAAAAFADGRIADCLARFAPDFSDRSAGQTFDRDTIRAVMLGLLHQRHRSIDVHIGEGSAVLEDFDAAAGTARVRCEVVVTGGARVADPERAASWAVAVDAAVGRGPDGEWRILRSEHRTLAGRAPYGR